MPGLFKINSRKVVFQIFSCSAFLRLIGLAFFFSGLVFISGCGQSIWSDRTSSKVDNIRIDSVLILPKNSRFIFADSSTGIQVKGLHLGYVCSKILNLNLSLKSSSDPSDTIHTLTYGLESQIQLPEQPTCAIDSGKKDTVLYKVFTGSADSIYLVNSLGKRNSAARLVHGKLNFDSFKGKLNLETYHGLEAKVIHSSDSLPWTYRDTLGTRPRMLFSDSLNSCRLLNTASVQNKGDTIQVDFSYIVLDSLTVADTCKGFRRDSISVDAR